MSDYESFKQSVEKAAKHWNRICSKTLKHGKPDMRRWNHVNHKGVGQPANPGFKKCYKPYEKLACQAAIAEGVFCMVETACWRQKE